MSLSRRRLLAGLPTAFALAAGIVGINVLGSSSDRETTYGESSCFAAVSGLRTWLLGVLPGLRFI